MGMTKLLAAALLVLASGGLQAQAPSPAPSGSDAEVNQLKIEMQRMRGEIDALKAQIGRLVQYIQQRDGLGAGPQAQQNPRGAVAGIPSAQRVNIGGAPMLGRADAPVTIIEFSDFECPFCQRFSASTLPEIKRDYVETGKVRYVFLDFPLENIHPRARKAAEAAQCAAEQGKFWEMHDLLFAQSGNLDISQYGDFARKLGLDASAFDLCLKSGKQTAKINRSLASASAIGINSTPSFIITKSERGDIINGGTIVTGANTYQEFRQVIEQILAGTD